MPFVHFDLNENIAIVTIARQDKMNALNPVIMDELESIFCALEKNDACRVIILTGAGEKAFVAGADINQFPTITPDEAMKISRHGQKLFTKIERSTKPVIAAVNGYALGGGCELALACHLRYASENAFFGQPEVNLGVIAGYGGTQRLPRLIGTGNALDLLLSGRMVSAQEAKEMGIANKVFPLATFMEDVLKVAKLMVQKGPLALKYALKSVYEGQGLPIEKALEVEAQMFKEVFNSQDRVEGCAAFIEKRKPLFKGN
jgi:enoyl-CoA hydratase